MKRRENAIIEEEEGTHEDYTKKISELGGVFGISAVVGSIILQEVLRWGFCEKKQKATRKRLAWEDVFRYLHQNTEIYSEQLRIAMIDVTGGRNLKIDKNGIWVGAEGYRMLSEGRLRSVDHVDETVWITFLAVQIGHAHWIGDHRSLVYEQEECLLWMELEASPNDWHEFSYSNMVWDQEFTTVHEWQTAFSIESLDDYWHFVWLLATDLFNVFLAFMKRPSFFEWWNDSGDVGSSTISAHRCLCVTLKRG